VTEMGMTSRLRFVSALKQASPSPIPPCSLNLWTLLNAVATFDQPTLCLRVLTHPTIKSSVELSIIVNVLRTVSVTLVRPCPTAIC